MFRLKYTLQDEADDDAAAAAAAGPGPGETSAKLTEIDETNRGDKVSAAVAALPEDEEGDVPAKTAAELGADEIAKAEAKALSEKDDDTKTAAEKAAAVEAAKTPDADKKAAEEAAAAAKSAAKAPSGKQIPKHRYDAAQAARRDAETRALRAETELQELQTLQNQTPPPATTPAATATTPLDQQIDALDKKVDDLTEEGKADEARETRRELRKLERQQMVEEAQSSAQAVATESVEQTELRTAIENIEDAIPALNPDDADTFDKILSDNVNELADAFEANGHSPAAALYKAIDFAIPATADEESEDGDLPVDERIEKNIDVATRTPSKLDDASKTGLDSDKAGLRSNKAVNVMDMSEKVFDEYVSDEEQEKLARGDVVGVG